MDVYRASQLSCPRCATMLSASTGTRYTCDRCRGLWIDDADFRELVRTMAPDLDPEASIPFADRKTAAALPCPHCSESLRATRFGGIPLDRCARAPHAGLWLDADELQHVLHAVGDGFARRESMPSSVGVSINSVTVYRDESNDPARAPWVPEPEPDRVTVLDLLRRLLGRPRPPEP